MDGGVFETTEEGGVPEGRAEDDMVGQDGDDDGGDQAPSEVDVDGEEVQQVEVELTTGF